jgi:Terpene cyclase DEP1
MSKPSTVWPARTYFIFAAVGLVTVSYFIVRSLIDPVGVPFLDALFANWTSTILVIDMLIAIAAAIVWIIVEARRLHMRWALWLLLVATTPIAFSLPLFLGFRERRLTARSQP